jgi:2-iminobutanoate/2-iminopropanoate deaminase
LGYDSRKARAAQPQFLLGSKGSAGYAKPHMRPHVINPAGSPKPVGPYSHAVRVGDFLFCSGQIPLTKEGQMVEGGIREQTRQVLLNVSAILQDQALTCENVVKATVFMTNLGEFADMNAVYSEFFQDRFPARSTVQVAALPRGSKVEIEVVACYPTP